MLGAGLIALSANCPLNLADGRGDPRDASPTMLSLDLLASLPQHMLKFADGA